MCTHSKWANEQTLKMMHKYTSDTLGIFASNEAMTLRNRHCHN